MGVVVELKADLEITDAKKKKTKKATKKDEDQDHDLENVNHVHVVENVVGDRAPERKAEIGIVLDDQDAIEISVFFWFKVNNKKIEIKKKNVSLPHIDLHF